ncbi:hypothetical protein Q3G72_012197 [Acer saccharum]|nr:hypothetical protein Q3G72_012197 [Acer saccharum]
MSDSQAKKSWLGREVRITKQEVMARIGKVRIVMHGRLPRGMSALDRELACILLKESSEEKDSTSIVSNLFNMFSHHKSNMPNPSPRSNIFGAIQITADMLPTSTSLSSITNDSVVDAHNS